MPTTITPLTRIAVLECLRGVVDPEIGLDIVTLGLIYGVEIADTAVRVTMTLTTRGCPLHMLIEQAVRATLEGLEGARTVTLEVVWNPPWHPAMIDRAVLA